MKHRSMILAYAAAIVFGMCAAPVISLAAEDEAIVETYTDAGEWCIEDGQWRFKPSNIDGYATGPWEIDGITYVFDIKGYLATGGWIQIEDQWLYTDAYGVASIGWEFIGGNWYYFDEFGYMVTEKQLIDNHIYNFAPSGEMYIGWNKVSDIEWAYSDTSGAAVYSFFDCNPGWAASAYNEKGEEVPLYGWQMIEGNWYYFSDPPIGYMAQDTMKEIDGKVYAFGPDGVLRSEGWYHDGEVWYYIFADGSIAIGWAYIDGNWYYFDEDGWMVYDHWEIDGKQYLFSPSGSLLINTWQKQEDGWYYATDDGSVAIGWKYIDGNWYYFNRFGMMYSGGVEFIEDYLYSFADGGQLYVDGWYPDEQLEKYWNYSNASGVVEMEIWFAVDAWVGDNLFKDGEKNNEYLAGWYLFDGYYYYFGKNGEMYQNKQVDIDGCRYAFGPYANMLTGWIADDTSWYYTYPSGALVTGWKYIDGYWYYFDDQYVMYADAVYDIGGYRYAFTPSGNMYENSWAKDGENWIYAGGSGALVRGWQKINGSWYYFDDQCVMYADAVYDIGGYRYAFTSSGNMYENSWAKDGDDWIYAGASGALVTDWCLINGNWYLFDDQGILIS